MSQRVAGRTRLATPIAVGLGLAALAARVPSTWAILVTVGVGLLGLIAPVPPAAKAASAPVPASRRTAVVTWAGALALGIGALLIAGRLPSLLGIGLSGLVVRRAGAWAVTASALAAIAEELFFRRLVYGWLATWGPVVAIGGSAALFAAVHVPVYGFAVIPIDAAAGLLLGWQRWMTRGWTASGVTHLVANLIAEGVIA
ncbi:MAG TPA: CPBP family intramembrane glutamic endopeptidase [Actinomycetota bacterium]|nr:CPBP family intramembrane glutamic endopeptidase [Actinomycetota bacterium]